MSQEGHPSAELSWSRWGFLKPVSVLFVISHHTCVCLKAHIHDSSKLDSKLLSAWYCQYRHRQAGRQTDNRQTVDRQTDRQHAVSAMQWLFLFAYDMSLSMFVQLGCSQCSRSSAPYIACAALQCPYSASAYKPGLSQLLDPTLNSFSRADLPRCFVHHH